MINSAGLVAPQAQIVVPRALCPACRGHGGDDGSATGGDHHAFRHLLTHLDADRPSTHRFHHDMGQARLLLVRDEFSLELRHHRR